MSTSIMTGTEGASEKWPESPECPEKQGQALASAERTDRKGKVRITQGRRQRLQSVAPGKLYRSAPTEGHLRERRMVTPGG